MYNFNELLSTGQRIAAEIALAARKDISAVDLAIENGLDYYVPDLIESAIQNQTMSAMHYDKVRYHMGIEE